MGGMGRMGKLGNMDLGRGACFSRGWLRGVLR